jgi:hypothetical protein
MSYRYILQPYGGMATRYTCPQCHRHKIFTRYIDSQTGTPLNDIVGRCSREDRCGYHYKPADYFKQHGNLPANDFYRAISFEQYLEPDYLPFELVEQSIDNIYLNNFTSYLLMNFGNAFTTMRMYRVGTSKHWMGATIFWQIDADENVRTGKIMLYDANTGKRVKQPYNHIAWMHKLVGKSESAVHGPSTMDHGHKTDFNLRQCFFGEHLLKHTSKPIAICESEKSAIIAAICYPQLTWLASGGLAGLTAEKCKCLANRKVILVPDLNGYDKWKEKAATISSQIPSVKFTIMNLLEQNAQLAHREQGLDIADFVRY